VNAPLEYPPGQTNPPALPPGSPGQPTPLPGEPGSPTAPPGPPRQMTARMPVHRVWATYVFLGIIVAVFLAQLASIQFLGGDIVAAMGEKDNHLIAQGEYWRLFTSIFLHGSILHIGFNAYALYIIGRDVERFSGALRFTIIFLLAGLSGSVFSLIFTAEPSLGASGAIFGLIGALAVFLYRHRKLFGERGRRNLQQVVIIALINFVFGLQGGIDNWAHLGGLIGGLVLAGVLGPVWAVNWNLTQGGQPVISDQEPLGGRQWLLVLAFAVAVAVLAFAGAARYAS
jgi:rhomboid protease GluP